MTHNTQTRFAHERLDVYRFALELLRGVEELTTEFPRGHGELRDQLRRAATATVLNTAEGAARMHVRDKAMRFGNARAECGECAAALDIAGVIGIAPAGDVTRLRRQANRVSAMLMGLIRNQHRRLD